MIESVAFFIVAAIVLVILLPKRFEATTKLMVQSSDTTDSILSELGLEEMAMSLQSGSDSLENKIALALMRPVLEEVIWNLQIRDRDGKLLKTEKLANASPLSALLAEPTIELEAEESTTVLDITASSPEPELSRLMADTLANVYIQQTEERANVDVKEADAFIKEQLEIIKKNLDDALANISSAQQAEEIIDLETEVKAAVSRVSQLMLGVEESAAIIEGLNAQIRQEMQNQNRESTDLVRPSSIASNPQIRVLRENLSQLRQARDSELVEKTEDNPDIILIDEQIATAEKELKLALEEQHDLSSTIDDMKLKKLAEEKKLKENKASIVRMTKDFGVFPEKMRRISQLKLAADATEKLYMNLQEQSYQIAIAEALNVSDLSIVEPAKAPERQSSPKILLYLAAGIFLGLCCGFALIVGFEYLDDSIKTPEELREAWDLPQLGMVPLFGKRDEDRMITEVPAQSPVSEAFRTIRNSIAYATLDKPPRHIAVTSALPGEGKSTIVTNLAISLARFGKRVVILDADFRRPSQHRYWPNTNNHMGVTNLLLGEMNVEQALQELPVPNLRLLAAGAIPPDPGRLVESLKMRQVLMDVARTCDIVLVDTPPVLVVNDGIVLGRQVDQVLMVVEAGKSSRKALADLQAAAGSANIEPMGLVLNKVDTSPTGGYYRYRYYRGYYKSHDERSEEGKRRWIRGKSRSHHKRRKGGAA